MASHAANCSSACILQSWFVFADSLAEVENRIAHACAVSGRNRNEITLLAVTKVFPAEVIIEAWELGLREFGENYVQEFSEKAPKVAHLSGARFHLIGHLQSNKAARAAQLFNCIQTIDSPKLARRLNDCDRQLDVMIEVKLSEEESKHGVDPADLPGLIEAIEQCPNLNLRGLMTMPPWSDDAERSRPYFRKLRQVAEAHTLKELSMGMSHDFEVAIQEGST